MLQYAVEVLLRRVLSKSAGDDLVSRANLISLESFGFVVLQHFVRSHYCTVFVATGLLRMGHDKCSVVW